MFLYVMKLRYYYLLYQN